MAVETVGGIVGASGYISNGDSVGINEWSSDTRLSQTTADAKATNTKRTRQLKRMNCRKSPPSESEMVTFGSATDGNVCYSTTSTVLFCVISMS